MSVSSTIKNTLLYESSSQILSSFRDANGATFPRAAVSESKGFSIATEILK